MNVRMFCCRGNIWSGKLDLSALEKEIAEWFAANPQIRLREIKHDPIGSFWTWPQLVVSVYCK